MDTPRGGNNGRNGAAEESSQADGNNNVAEDGSEDDITLEAPTMTDLLPLRQPQNGEGSGVREGGPSNGNSFAGLEPHSRTLINDNSVQLSTDNVAATNLETPYSTLNHWLQSPDGLITDLLHLLALRETRNQPRRSTLGRNNHEHKRQKRK
ncbi:hypothetical protein V491_06432 [Pseudogymnoascus sp. VKM F-3775]|nr:hypothetical protein V491_06432 [Pseudogymnoascus sp. VKM F-3775]